MTRTTEIFFVVDGLRLEAQACLLAPSLKASLLPNQRAVAYVREDYAPKLLPFTRETLERSGIELREIPNTNGTHAPWTSPYPHGNKLLAAAQPRDCSISVFLDTDTILAAPVDFGMALGDGLVGACVSDYRSETGTDADWAAYYGTFGLTLPRERVRLNAGRQLESLPYFNAGMVVWRERFEDGARSHIGRDWLEAAERFERDETHPYARVNIDQFTLPILGYLRGLPVKVLDQHLNFNIQAFGDSEGTRQSLAHYHRLGILWAHARHGRFALEQLVAVMGQSAPNQFLHHFGEVAKRKRMKVHLAAMEAALTADGAGADPQE